MKSIKRRFVHTSMKHPDWSSLISFSEAVRATNFSRRAIEFWFNRLVEKDDYSRGDKKLVLRHILSRVQRLTAVKNNVKPFVETIPPPVPDGRYLGFLSGQNHHDFQHSTK